MTRTGPDRQPPREVFEFPVEMHRTPVVHHDQLVGHGIEQVAVVQDQHDGAQKLLYGNAKCLMDLKIQLVSGLVQVHEIGALVGDQSEHQARLLVNRRPRLTTFWRDPLTLDNWARSARPPAGRDRELGEH